MKKLYYALAGLTLAVAAQGTAMLTAAPEASLPSVTSVETSKTFKDYVTVAIPMYDETVDLGECYSGLAMPQFVLSTTLTVNEDCPFAVTLYRDGATVKSITSSDSELLWVEENMAVFVFSESPITTEGLYTLNIPDGFLLDGTTPVKGSSFSYRIGEAKGAVSFLDCINQLEGIPTDTPLDMKEYGSIGQFVFNTTASLSINKNCTTPVSLYAGDSAVAAATIAATDEYDGSEGKPFAFIPDRSTLVLDFGKTFSEAVDYRLVIPEGFFTLDGTNVAATTLNYLFAPQTQPVGFADIIAGASPELGVVDLNEYDGLNALMFVLNAEVTVNTKCTTVLRMNIAGEVMPVGRISASATGEDEPRIIIMDGAEPMSATAQAAQTSLVMWFGETPINAPGTYTVTIPEGFFLIDGVECQQSTLSYTIEAKAEELSYTFDPTPGSTVDSLADIYFNVPEGTSVVFRPDAITLSNGTESYTLSTFKKSATQIWMYNLNFPDTPGEWTLTIPANSMMYNNVANETAITATWTIKEKGSFFDYTFDPADGSTVESLDDIYLNVASDKTVEVKSATLSNGVDTYPLTAFQNGPNSVWMYNLTFPNTPGEWTLTIPSGDLWYNGKPYSDAITATWTIEGKAVVTLPEPTASPADGATVNSTDDFKTITLTWPEGTQLTAGEEYTYFVTLSGPSGFPVMYYIDSATNNVLVLKTNSDLSSYVPGDYELSVGAGTVLINGTASPAYTYHYTYEEAAVVAKPEYTFDPSDGSTVENLEDIYFNVPAGNTVAITSGSATLSNGVDSYPLTTFQQGDNTVWMFNFTFTNAPGEWTITIPAGALTYNGEVYNEEITATWTIKGGSASTLPEPMVSPAPSATVTSSSQFETITLTWPEGTQLTAGEEYTYFVTLSIPGTWTNFMYGIYSVDGNVLTLKTAANLSDIESGEYELSVGAGTVFINGTASPAYTYNYTYQAPAAGTPDYYFDPSNGATVSKLEDIYLHLNGGVVTYNTSGDNNVITITNGVDTKTIGAFAEGTALWLFPVLPIEEAGEWTLTIPANRICFDGVPYAEVITATWTIEAAIVGNDFPTPVISLNPESTVSAAAEFNTLTLTYPEGTVFELGEEGTYYAILSQPGLMTNANYDFSVEGNVVTLTAQYPVSGLESGKYVLEISPNALFIGSKGNPGYSYEYTFEAPAVGEFDYTITPAPGTTVNNLNQITFTVGEGHTIGYNTTGYITDEVIMNRLAGTVTDNVLVLSNLTYGEEEGEWTLVLPAGSLVYDGNLVNYEITASWTVSANVSGIAGLSADGTFTVFTVDGKLLLLNAGIEAVSDLESGLYIINGKKVLLRK